MADLLDVASATGVVSVRIGEQRVTVRGVSIEAIASLVSRFPDLKSLINGGDGGDIIARLIAGCGMAAAPIIAAGCGHLGEEQYERHAATAFNPEDQLKLLTAIFGLTFPNGIGSFVEALTNLMGPAGERAKPKTVKIRWKKSPTTSSPSPDTPDSLPTIQ